MPKKETKYPETICSFCKQWQIRVDIITGQFLWYRISEVENPIVANDEEIQQISKAQIKCPVCSERDYNILCCQGD